MSTLKLCYTDDITNFTIHAAAFIGNLETVKLLVSQTKYLIYFSFDDDDKNIPFHKAAEGGQIHILEYFIHGNEVPINIQNAAGNSALHLAALNGRPEAVAFLIEEGASIKILNKKRCNVLHYASQSKSVETVKLLLAKGIPIETKDEDGCTPLHHAAMAGRTEVVSFLIDNGANVDAKDANDWCPLHFCIIEGHVESIKIFLEKAYSNKREYLNHVSLMLAVSVRHLSVVQLLCENGCRPDVKLPTGSCSPMSLACREGNVEICKYFLKQFPELFEKSDEMHLDILVESMHDAACNGHLDIVKLLVTHMNSLGYLGLGEYQQSPLHSAALGGQIHIAKYFLHDLQVPIDIKSKTGISPLDMAALNGNTNVVAFLLDEGASISNGDDTVLHYACLSTSVDTVKFLIATGIPVDVRNIKRGATPLHGAARCGRTEIVSFLIDNGAEVNARNVLHESPLHLSARKGHVETARKLIEKGSSLCAETSVGYTPLMLAVLSGHLSVVKLLCDKGCRPNETSKMHDQTPMTLAASDGHTEICQYFLKQFAHLYKRSNSSLLKHIEENEEIKSIKMWFASQWERVKYFMRLIMNCFLHAGSLNYNADKDTDSFDDFIFCIHIAAMNGHLDIVRLLVNHDESLLYACAIEKQIPIHSAAMRGHTHIIKYFLRNQRVPINIQNEPGNTALHLAARAGATDTVIFLIDEGASIEIRNASGCTVLHYACLSTSADIEIVKLLIAKGIPIDVKNETGSEPLHVTAESGNTELVSFLIDNGADMYARDNGDICALHLCIWKGHVETIKLLVEKGCSLQVQHVSGRTPLMLAVIFRHLPVVQLLCEHGCRPDETLTNVRDEVSEESTDLTPMSISFRDGFTEICEYFAEQFPELYNS